jgi:hypothetical protein
MTRRGAGFKERAGFRPKYSLGGVGNRRSLGFARDDKERVGFKERAGFKTEYSLQGEGNCRSLGFARDDKERVDSRRERVSRRGPVSKLSIRYGKGKPCGLPFLLFGSGLDG